MFFHDLIGIRTHGLSVQAIKTYASDHADIEADFSYIAPVQERLHALTCQIDVSWFYSVHSDINLPGL
jgi:hypothetical protein